MPKNSTDKTAVCIMAGGFGPRLWPLSRTSCPKPFLRLGKKSLIQLTYQRALLICPPQNIFISTTPHLLHLCKKHLPQVPKDNYCIEPIRRNTALSHALSTAVIANRYPGCTIVHLASDHFIPNLLSFRTTLRQVIHAANSFDKIITTGFPVLSAHTGYDYLRLGHPVDFSNPSCFTLNQFIPKPSAKSASSLVDNKFLWHGNMYTWRPSVFLALSRHLGPKYHTAVSRLFAAIGTPNEKSQIQSVFQMAEPIPFEKLLYKNAHLVLAVKAEFTWTDLGNWREIGAISQLSESNNSLFGKVDPELFFSLQSQKNTVYSHKKKVISLLGVDDLFIIDTPDALLVGKKSQAQDVKLIVDSLIKSDLQKYI